MSRPLPNEPTGVPVLDGPCEGARLNYSTAAPAKVLFEGDGVPEGYVARYRYDPKRHGYVFKEYDQLLMRVERK